MEFQVKKDIKTTLLKFAHKLWPKQCKHLFADLQTTIAWVDLGMTLSPADYAERLAALTQKCGLDGVVCSAQEAVRFKQVFGQEFKLVTPGIRPQGSEAGDQRRIMTPEQALSAGVDYMVIGRPVTQSVDPAQTLKAINASLQRSA